MGDDEEESAETYEAERDELGRFTSFELVEEDEESGKSENRGSESTLFAKNCADCEKTTTRVRWRDGERVGYCSECPDRPTHG